jgi:hypothetical protein
MISFRALPEHAFGQRFVTNSEQRPTRLLANKNVMRADWHSNQPHVMGRLISHPNTPRQMIEFSSATGD